MASKDDLVKAEKQQIRIWLTISRERHRSRYKPINPYEPKPVSWLPPPRKIDGNLESI